MTTSNFSGRDAILEEIREQTEASSRLLDTATVEFHPHYEKVLRHLLESHVTTCEALIRLLDQ